MDDWIAGRGLAVVDHDRLRALSERSDLKGWIQTASHLGAIGVATTALVLAPTILPNHLMAAVWLPLLFLQGVLINCLYAGLQLNDAFGHLFGFAILNPFLTDRWSHFAHHRATQDPCATRS